MPQDSLSALLDGECSGPELDRLLDELDRSPELTLQWSRLCLAREAREGTQIRADQPCICAEVMGQLDEAPAAADAKVVDLAVHRALRRPTLTRVWKPLVGFAAAASMGAAAVYLVQPAAAPSKSGVPEFTSGTLAEWNQNSYGDYTTPRTVASGDEAYAQMLREYLMDHSNAISDEGVGGTLRYARFAAHTAEYRPQAEELP